MTFSPSTSDHRPDGSQDVWIPGLDRLRAAAHLYHIDTQPLAEARVLSLSVGVNPGLTGFALTHPESQVLGLSLGAADTQAAQRQASQSGVDNVSYADISLDQIDARMGTFDYIVIPDVYGSLPPEAAQYLLQTCESLLSSNGLACIGHPTYPGAKAYEIVRDAILLHLRDQEIVDPTQHADQALAAIKLFTDGLAAGNTMAPALRQAASHFTNSIHQGHLNVLLGAPQEMGSYFIEFAQMAQQTGLACVGDANAHQDTETYWGGNVHLTSSLLGIGQEGIVRQQYVDFSTGRARRHTLLVHLGRFRRSNSSPDLDRLADLRWAGCWEAKDGALPDVPGQLYLDISGRSWLPPSATHARILDALYSNWPYSFDVSQLTQATQTPIKEVLPALRDLFQQDMLQYCLDMAPCDHLPDTGPIRILPGLIQSNTTDTLTASAQAETLGHPVSARLHNTWGEPITLTLSAFEAARLNAGLAVNAHDFIPEKIISTPLNDGASSHLGTAILSADLQPLSNLLRRLWQAGLLAGSKRAWSSLLGDILDASQGQAACWALYLQANPAHTAKTPTEITPQQKAQLDHLQILLSRLDYTTVEPLAHQATARFPARMEGWVALTRSLSGRGLHHDALRTLSKIRTSFCQDPQYHRLVALVLAFAKRYEEALCVGRNTLSNNASSGELYNALGLACMNSLRLASAEQYLKQGMRIDPDFRPSAVNLISLYTKQGKHQEGMALCRSLLAGPNVDGDYRAAIYHNMLFFANYDPDRTAEQIYQDYQAFEKELYSPVYKTWKSYKNSRNPNRRLRIGYVSADFKEHAVSRFLMPVYEHHDKSAFEIYSYSNLAVEDSVTARYRDLSDHWRSIYGVKDDEAAQQVRDDKIDILVDLSGHTGGNRLGVFARKPAPVSLTWLGYGYTTGVSAIDYFLGDDALCPPGFEHLFAEKPWRLKGPWAVYAPPATPESGPLPALTEGRVTFVSLSRVIRINERVIRTWARILSSIPNSRLVLNSLDFSDSKTCASIQDLFALYGVESSQLMMGYTSPPWHSLQHSDIGLDCFPHNAGTTLMDMLNMGVPYITLADRPSVGRIGSAPLHCLGHSEWIAADENEYIAKAIGLASNISQLALIRKNLQLEFQKSEIMNQEKFTKKLETAFREMFMKWSQGS